ncbi:hypothetical protein LJC36_06170, partial [Desulfovibrio sp. OttesenSCG-928-C14]|nr:hypothetical protein [Desulfovibrio sp. OttesenSCG-928-C14]
LLACAFFPKAILLLCSIPDAVMGALLLYLMATQLASGLAMLNAEQGAAGFSGGMTVGLPLMIGLLLSFAPAPVLEALPELLRPLLGNGFVMGTLAVVLMEHVIFRKNKGS